jgi:hypothetical protein
MGEPPERDVTSVPSKVGFETTQTVIRQQAWYWHSLGEKQIQIRDNAKAERMHGKFSGILRNMTH